MIGSNQLLPALALQLTGWKAELAAIVILLFAVGIVMLRLPRVDLGYDQAYRRRRLMNWLPLGMTYAFLYMGRYNLTVAKTKFENIASGAGNPLMSNEDFGWIFGLGTAVYGVAFIINGPLTDRFGGRKAILVSAFGSALANLLMGLATWQIIERTDLGQSLEAQMRWVFVALYSMNMYFQSFGAVAVVKVNAPWFHVRERGVFGAIFGILISLGIYFAYDWGRLITTHLSLYWVFVIPALILSVFFVIDLFLVRDSPGQAGLTDFDTADASSGDDGPQLGAVAVFKLMLTNPVIVTIAFIEFCSGFLRQAIMQWYTIFAKQTDAVLGLRDSFVNQHWGIMLCCAGILGGVLAGVISDRVFQSRRGPVAAILYAAMVVGAIALTFVYTTAGVGVLVIVMSMCVIGVHGMLSGTASMDFGGKKNAGVAVGIIDGFVYAGTAVMALSYGWLLPREQLGADGQLTGPATDPANWTWWPILMIPVAFAGFLLALRVWNAKPKPKAPPAPKPEAAAA